MPVPRKWRGLRRVDRRTGTLAARSIPWTGPPVKSCYRRHQRRQAGGGNGLAVALGLLVRDHELDAEVRELVGKHGFRLVDVHLAAFAGGHATEDEQVLDIVEIRVVGDGIAEAGADRFVDLLGASI